jgi:hypothetical protein
LQLKSCWFKEFEGSHNKNEWVFDKRWYYSTRVSDTIEVIKNGVSGDCTKTPEAF